jgi:hypothetical protein
MGRGRGGERSTPAVTSMWSSAATPTVVQACALQVGLMRQAALLGQDQVVLDRVDL